ncbi:MAG: hypothetical protein ACYTF0_08415, partial [Planctomycetota bacterium]
MSDTHPSGHTHLHADDDVGLTAAWRQRAGRRGDSDPVGAPAYEPTAAPAALEPKSPSLVETGQDDALEALSPEAMLS